MLLPTEHGIFLGERSAATKELEIRTFVDNARLNGAQLEAVREIHRITQEQVCAEALQALVPGWMGTNGDANLRGRLLQAWQHFGWRFEEDRLHPGLSDRAWKDRDGPGPKVVTPKASAGGMMLAA